MLLICILFRTQLCNITLLCNIWFLFFHQPSLFVQPIFQPPGNMRLRVISVDRGVGSIWEGGRIHYISSLAVMYIHIPTPHLSPSPPPVSHICKNSSDNVYISYAVVVLPILYSFQCYAHPPPPPPRPPTCK